MILSEVEIPAFLHSRIRRLYRQQVAEVTAPERLETERLRRQLTQLEEESRGYVRLAAQGKISDAEFDQERGRVATAIASARHELALLDSGGRSRLSDLDLALTLSAHLGAVWERCDPGQRKALARMLFTEISVTNAGDVIHYDLADPFAYLVSLKIAPSSPSGRGSERSNSVGYALPDRTLFEQMEFPGKVLLSEIGLLGRLT